jgi:hypothetical protein
VKGHALAASVYARSLRLGGLVALAIALVGSVIGYMVTGLPGVFGALMGAGLALVFMGLTAVSILVGKRVASDASFDPRFFGIVLGAWVLKLIVFVVAAIWLRGQTWLDPATFAIAAIVAVVGLLVADVVAFQTTRTPYVDVALPGEPADSQEKQPPIS